MESKEKNWECVIVVPKLDPKPAEEGNEEATNLFSTLGWGVWVLSTLESWSEGKIEPGNWCIEQSAKAFFKFAQLAVFLPKEEWSFPLQSFIRVTLTEGHRFN